MRIMYKNAHLIHNDLLEHILWYNGHCYFIGFSHALNKNDKDARDVLLVNCKTITKVSYAGISMLIFLHPGNNFTCTTK